MKAEIYYSFPGFMLCMYNDRIAAYGILFTSAFYKTSEIAHQSTSNRFADIDEPTENVTNCCSKHVF